MISFVDLFEDITEDEFNRREAGKSRYRNELFAQMAEAQRRKDEEKQKKWSEDIQQEEKIYSQLQQMQDEYVKDEEKRGNRDARKRIQKIQKP